MGTTHSVLQELRDDNVMRACRCAIWIALLEAERLAGWTDVRDDLYHLHALVTDRLHRADYDEWRRRLDAEGPHQPEPHDDV